MTTDGGETWTEQAIPLGSSALHFVDATAGWAVGSNGRIAKWSPENNTGIKHNKQVSGNLPTQIALWQNYPNPFNPATTIRFGVPDHTQPITLRVYNLSGQKVRNLVDGAMEAGTHIAFWDGRDALGQDVASGVYFYRMSAGDRRYIQTRKMVLIR